MDFHSGRTFIVAAIFVVLQLLGTTAYAATDSSFGEDGIVIKDFGFGDDEAYAAAVQADGKILIAGYTYNGADKNLFVARYDTDGVLDSDFHAGGVFTYGAGGENYLAGDISLRADGRILVTASGGDAQAAGYVLQLDSSGYLDKSFAADGVYKLSAAGKTVTNTAVAAVDSGGTFMLVATAENADGVPQVLVAKLNSAGVMDASFGDSGIKEVALSVPFRAEAVVGAEASSFYVAGAAIAAEKETAAVLKFALDGSVDSTFGKDGVATIFASSVESSANALLFDEENDALWLGGAERVDDHSETFVARLSAAGVLDETFGESGVATTLLGYDNNIYAIDQTADGGIIATGFASTGDDQDVLIITVSGATASSSEAADSSEADGSSTDNEQAISMSLVDVTDGDDVGYAIAVADDGELYVAGSAANDTNLDVSLLRVSASVAAASSLQAGVTTSGYYIFTMPVSAITHTSAVSGGQISKEDTDSCDAQCSAECTTSLAPETCYSDCMTTCSSDTLTVTTYGVCYGTSSKPEYTTSSDTTTDDTTTDSDTTDTTDSSTSIFPQGNLLGAYVVHSGCTEDGSGTGSYESEILDITPGIEYHVRAYAVLSDGTVLYGNERTFSTKDGCFIATAAYGSIFADEVRAFRTFRDRFLMRSSAGQKFVAIYYRLSPSLADIIRDDGALRLMVRVLLYPWYLLVSLLQHTGMMVVCGLFILFSLLFQARAGLFYWMHKS